MQVLATLSAQQGTIKGAFFAPLSPLSDFFPLRF